MARVKLVKPRVKLVKPRVKLVKRCVPALIAISTLCATLLTSRAQAEIRAADVIGTCDRAAASKQDPSKPFSIPGVSPDAIDATVAIPNCAAAAAAQPGDARILFQYGRALQAGKRSRDALEVYKRAASLGSALAKNNLGVIYNTGEDGLSVDKKQALALFMEAAHDGVSIAKQNAANLLAAGEGVAAVDYEGAARYWRSLADNGDAGASEKLGLAIKDGKVLPTLSNEVGVRLRMAADSGRYAAAEQYALYLRDRDKTPETLTEGAHYALLAYHLSLAAWPDHEESWIVDQWWTFRLYDTFVTEGAENLMPDAEYKQAKSDFTPARKFTVPTDCGNGPATTDLYIWQWTRNYPQTDPEVAWLDRVQGCKVSQDIIESFRKLFKIAADNKVSFPDMAVDALEAKNNAANANQPASGSATQPSTPSSHASAKPDNGTAGIDHTVEQLAKAWSKFDTCGLSDIHIANLRPHAIVCIDPDGPYGGRNEDRYRVGSDAENYLFFQIHSVCLKNTAALSILMREKGQTSLASDLNAMAIMRTIHIRTVGTRLGIAEDTIRNGVSIKESDPYIKSLVDEADRSPLYNTVNGEVPVCKSVWDRASTDGVNN